MPGSRRPARAARGRLQLQHRHEGLLRGAPGVLGAPAILRPRIHDFQLLADERLHPLGQHVRHRMHQGPDRALRVHLQHRRLRHL